VRACKYVYFFILIFYVSWGGLLYYTRVGTYNLLVQFYFFLTMFFLSSFKRLACVSLALSVYLKIYFSLSLSLSLSLFVCVCLENALLYVLWCEPNKKIIVS
jgi:hypothetical protein